MLENINVTKIDLTKIDEQIEDSLLLLHACMSKLIHVCVITHPRLFNTLIDVRNSTSYQASSTIFLNFRFGRKPLSLTLLFYDHGVLYKTKGFKTNLSYK